MDLLDSQVLFIQQLQSKMPDFLVNTFFFSQQQQPLNLCLASFLAALLIARKSWGPQLPVCLYSYSPGVLILRKYFLRRGIPWVAKGSQDCWLLLLYQHNRRARKEVVWVQVLGLTLGVCHMTQTNCFTILGFYFIIELDSNKGVERTLPIRVPRTEGSAGLNLSRLYSIYKWCNWGAGEVLSYRRDENCFFES